MEERIKLSLEILGLPAVAAVLVLASAWLLKSLFAWLLTFAIDSTFSVVSGMFELVTSRLEALFY